METKQGKTSIPFQNAMEMFSFVIACGNNVTSTYTLCCDIESWSSLGMWLQVYLNCPCTTVLAPVHNI